MSTAFNVDELEVDVLEPRHELATPAMVSTCVVHPPPINISEGSIVSQVLGLVQHALPPSTCVIV